MSGASHASFHSALITTLTGLRQRPGAELNLRPEFWELLLLCPVPYVGQGTELSAHHDLALG